MRFPDSTEIRYRDEPPEPGSRIRSASGQEWFVAEALQSGRNTYTVFCVGRREYLADAGTAPSRGRVLAEDLVTLARRSVRADRSAEDDQAGKEELHPYLASVRDSDGRALEYLIYAATPGEAEREAREGAREWGANVVDVRLWGQPPVDRPARRSPAARLHSLFRRRAPSH